MVIATAIVDEAASLVVVMTSWLELLMAGCQIAGCQSGVKLVECLVGGEGDGHRAGGPVVAANAKSLAVLDADAVNQIGRGTAVPTRVVEIAVGNFTV